MKQFICAFVLGLLASIRLAANPFVYVPNYSSDDISIIDTESNTTIATIDLGSGKGPTSIAFNPEGTKGYISCNGDNTVAIIETTGNTIVGTVSVGTSPVGVAVSLDGEYVYVSCSGDDLVFVIDANTEMIANAITVGAAPQLLALSPDGTKLYVPCADDNIVNVIETPGLAVIATVAITDNYSPFGVAATPDGSEIYVTTNGDIARVSVIETMDYMVITTISVGGDPSARGIAISSSDDPKAYATDYNGFFLAAIDVNTSSFAEYIYMPASPSGPVVSADGNRLYVTGYDGSDGFLLVFDLTAGNMLIASPSVGTDPLYPAIVNRSLPPPASSEERAFKRPNNRR